MNLLRFDTANGTPEKLEGIAQLADLFLFIGSDGRTPTTFSTTDTSIQSLSRRAPVLGNVRIFCQVGPTLLYV